MPGCGKCGHAIDIVGTQVGRRDQCPQCGAELRACVHCRHYDPTVAKQCKEPFAEVPLDKESANFCEFYQLGDGGAAGANAESERARLRDAAESLFKKK